MKTTHQKFPFIRLLIGLTAGIIFQWYSKSDLIIAIILAFTSISFILIFRFLPPSKKFLLGWLQGGFIVLLFTSAGMITTWQQNIQHNKEWYRNYYQENDLVVATLQEPITEKNNSYKALAKISGVYQNKILKPSKGNILIYFKKEDIKPELKYGSQIIFNQEIQSIKNSGNPAAMNYNRYCLFQNITGQVFLSTKNYKILSTVKVNILQKYLFSIRDWALKVMQENIHSPKELGIAEALLIGYRNDLDKDLVQAYSNTGVVHIIAISGLHIGVIYAALLSFFNLFKRSKTKKWIEPIVILIVIWLFTLIAGAAPSVLRASVMFTFLLFGKFIGKNGNIYNTLAASAFVLLLINPFYLWDVGFQLSYSAVFSIILCYKRISNLFYFSNKSLRWVWQLSAVSLSAQVFTLPLVIYHFHQLPILFLFSNLVAVPLSGIILFEELALFVFSFWHSAATFIGSITEASIKLMNEFIEHIDKLAFSVWDGLHISIIQLIILLVMIGFIYAWIDSKQSKLLVFAMVCCCLFFMICDADIIHHKQQEKIIVYNVPKQTAIDVIAGNDVKFAGDSVVLTSTFLRNFNLKPSHTKDRVYSNSYTILPDIKKYILNINTYTFLMLSDCKFNIKPVQKIPIDVLVLSKENRQSPAEINNIFNCKYIIADGSVPAWKSAQLKKQFEQLHLRFFSTAQNGAFTLKM